MSIEFHCSQCQRLVKAPDSAGGKRGKCPYCNHSAYIPLPAGELEELSLAPMSDEDEQLDLELKRESTEFAATVGHAKAVPSDADTPKDEPAVGFDSEIESFVRAMHESRLEDAEAAAGRLKSLGKTARSQVKELSSGDGAPAIDGVPPRLVQAFLKNLLERVG